MLSQGKIGVQDAEDLLKAVSADPAATTGESDAGKKQARWLRIEVDKTVDGGRKKEVNVRVPVSLLRAGVRLSAMMPRLAGTRLGEKISTRLSEKLGAPGGWGDLDFDFSKIDPKDLEALIDEMGEMVIDVDGGRAQVRIHCE
jgi:hypothetical protein